MPRAGNNPNTRSVSRRDALVEMAFAAAAMTAATLPAVAGNGEPLPGLSNGHNWSPEFREWYALAQTLDAVMEADDAWETENPGARLQGEQSPYSCLCAKLEPLEIAIYERPVRSWTDVAELGMIALFWSDKEQREGDPDGGASSFALGRHDDAWDEAQGDRPHHFLIQAAAKMAMGGGNA